MFDNGNLHKLDECLACGSTDLVLTLDLGKQPLANSYKKTKEEDQERFPLAINRCQNCYHVQLTHAVNPDLMFKEYLYVSGTSFTMREHFKWFAQYAVETFTTYGNHVSPYNVLDIGCNDGTQLEEFHKLDVLAVGIDPAKNLYETSSKKVNAKIYCDYFNMDWSKKTDPGVFDILTAQNVFAHNSDPIDFLLTARNVMHDESLLFIQTSQADMILNGEFDTIYHEHISFYNVNSMNELCSRVALYLVDVIKCPLHGTSYIFVISKNPKFARPSNIQNLIAMERKAGLLTDETYIEYAEKCEKITKELRELVERYQSLEVGFNVVGYGAAAKGMTLLNYSGIRPDFIVDDNELKQGRFTPGSSVPIKSSDALNDLESATLFIPLAWNFFDEIYNKIKRTHSNKYDLFLKYFPKVETKE